jgi:hypothetical protein
VCFYRAEDSYTSCFDLIKPNVNKRRLNAEGSKLNAECRRELDFYFFNKRFIFANLKN